MAKITSFIAVLIVFILVISGGFATFMAEIYDKYGAANYSNETLEEYNKLSELESHTEDIKNKSMEMRSETGLTDILGGFFQSGYDAIKISIASFDIFYDMQDTAFDNSIIAKADVFKTGLIAITIVIIFLGILVGVIVKYNVI
jgi:hypothetical protein|tara:strand:- start:618 stop:1049 length:432 start_codon:yes stop_codon:yes gene_type:complete